MPDKPLSAAEGTTPVSPYPELTDAEFGRFVELWGGEADAKRQLEAGYGILRNLSGIEYLRRFRRKGILGWIDRTINGPLGRSPLEEVYGWHFSNCHGIYT